LRPKNLRDGGNWVRSGTLTWRNSRGSTASASFRVDEYLHEAEARLNFVADGRPMEQRIPCEYYVQFGGGRRWCFLCPSCGQRMEVLYLPAGENEFRCRDCHGLRYRSQERDLDFLLLPIMAEAGVPKRVARRYLKEAMEA
jgi:hypothetical protein